MRKQLGVIDGDGIRRCAWCGAEIDPIDWCLRCREAKKACRKPHKSLRKRSDAAFCNAECARMQRKPY